MIDRELEARMQMAQNVTCYGIGFAPQGEHQSTPATPMYHFTGSGRGTTYHMEAVKALIMSKLDMVVDGAACVVKKVKCDFKSEPNGEQNGRP